MMVVRRSEAGASTHSMLSRKKGRQYGEGHQKALQISVYEEQAAKSALKL
jgi:hypothetical protein